MGDELAQVFRRFPGLVITTTRAGVQISTPPGIEVNTGGLLTLGSLSYELLHRLNEARLAPSAGYRDGQADAPDAGKLAAAVEERAAREWTLFPEEPSHPHPSNIAPAEKREGSAELPWRAAGALLRHEIRRETRQTSADNPGEAPSRLAPRAGALASVYPRARGAALTALGASMLYGFWEGLREGHSKKTLALGGAVLLAGLWQLVLGRPADAAGEAPRWYQAGCWGSVVGGLLLTILLELFSK
jgi:hypothetical protein